MNGKILIGLLVVSLFFIFGCTGEQEPQEQIHEGSMDKDVMDKDAMNNGDIGNGRVSASYERFSKAEFDSAVSAGKPVFLEFYADWCPTCKSQKPVIESAFNSEQMPENVRGFQVHYKDGVNNFEDDQVESKYGIAYQHTHVILDPQGEVIHKSTGFLTEERIIELMNEAVGV